MYKCMYIQNDTKPTAFCDGQEQNVFTTSCWESVEKLLKFKITRHFYSSDGAHFSVVMDDTPTYLADEA